MIQDFVKFDRFDGTNFVHLQDKIRFLLTTLKVLYILDKDLKAIEPAKEDDTQEIIKQMKKHEEDELICRGHILNTLSDRLYDLYTNTKTTKDIWEALENTYKAEEECTKKFLITQYMEFKFYDVKPILPKIHELQIIVKKLSTLNIVLLEQFLVGAIMSKLPPSWRGHKKKILHKNEEISLEEILKHLRNDYFARDYRFKRSYNNELMVNSTKEELVTTLSEINARHEKVKGWWYDTDATIHVTYDRSLFKTFETSQEGREI
ncbi:uncharacterized protein LOC133815177 [Humulus lupulus]|uniref:uncharacterized protein LOC133815177 n=1 Tax=Humulus lupulus TaxID=3486 RepID=UPI002B414626|nr:uncharacterized protein LOC133815177 [Humulus lupulus]